MPPKTLWTIIIKVFGLLIFLNFINWLPQFFIQLSYLYINANPDYIPSSKMPWLFALQGPIELFVCWACLFRTDWLIKKLRLENGLSEESIQLNIHRSTVLKIVVIIIGMRLIIDGFPVLINQLITFYQNSTTFTLMKQNPASGWVIQSFLMVVIGYYMVAYNRLVVNFIEHQRKK